jgi:hypothetical protein
MDSILWTIKMSYVLLAKKKRKAKKVTELSSDERRCCIKSGRLLKTNDATRFYIKFDRRDKNK